MGCKLRLLSDLYQVDQPKILSANIWPENSSVSHLQWYKVIESNFLRVKLKATTLNNHQFLPRDSTSTIYYTPSLMYYTACRHYES
jgi:hypothetical protein